MKTIRLKTNSGCPLLAHNFYSRFEIISISIRIVTIPILWIGLHPAFFHRFHGYLVPDGIVTETFSPGIMMHRAITHRLHRMHNSYVCHELWTGASTGASTPPTGRGVAILSLFFPLSLSFRSFFFFFSAFRGNIRPLPRSHTRHNPSVVGYFRPILASFRRGNCCSGSQRVAISHEESPPFLAVNSFQPYLQTFRGEISWFPYSSAMDRGQSFYWNIFFFS